MRRQAKGYTDDDNILIPLQRKISWPKAHVAIGEAIKRTLRECEYNEAQHHTGQRGQQRFEQQHTSYLPLGCAY